MKPVLLANFIAAPFEATLALSVAGAYTAGQVLCDTAQIDFPRMPEGGAPLRGEITAMQVIDEDDQGQPLDLILMRSNVSLGTKRDVISITDTNAREIIHRVPVTSYLDLIASQQAWPDFAPLPFDLASRSIFLSAITRGTPTHTASGVRVRVWARFFNIDQF